MDYLQVSEYDIQKLKEQNTMLEMQVKMRELINQSCCSPITTYNPYNNPYPINCGCGYNPINYQMLNVNTTINSGFIDKETTIENKKVEEMIFDYNREFVYQSEWDKYGYDLDEYNSISDNDKELFERIMKKQFNNITKVNFFNNIKEIAVVDKSNIYLHHYFTDNDYKKYSYLKNYTIEQLNKKFQAYKNYKQNKQFINKYYDKIVPDNIQTNYDYIDELIRESKE